MFKNYYIFTLLCLLFATACQQQRLTERIDFLTGTWQIENKSTFEVWEKTSNTSLTGRSYKVVQGQQKPLESLNIKIEKNQVIYTAKVPTQNEGRAIPFTLNQNISDRLSFENASHDFPKKIQYAKVNENKLFVQVLGEQDKGFSYHLIRQKP